jgi:hypothetical protein
MINTVRAPIVTGNRLVGKNEIPGEYPVLVNPSLVYLEGLFGELFVRGLPVAV